MKHNYLKHLFTALLLLCTTVVTAHDFEVGGIYYKILSEEDKTVEVTFKGTSYNQYSNEYTGSVVIPESVIYNGVEYRVPSIGNNAFYNCTGLTSIEIPNSVTSIGNNAFSHCSKLVSVVIPNSVTTLGEYAFCGCNGLTSVVISSGITRLERSVFDSCYNLTSVEIPDGVTSIGKWAFSNCYALKSVTIPNSVTTIEEAAFSVCLELTNIVIPSSVTNIGARAFGQCNKLAGIVVDAENTVYDSRDNCNAIIKTSTNTLICGSNETVIPNSVTRIGDNAFTERTGLTSIEIPNSITNIGEYAFYGCTALESITSLIPAEELFAIILHVFDNVDKNACTLYVPYGAKETYAATAGWSEFVNIVELEKPATEVTVTINKYGCATYCSQYALDFSEVEGLKAYSAIGYKPSTQTVTLARVMTTGAGQGIFIKGEPGEYIVPIIDDFDEYTLNLLVGTLKQTTVNSTDGEMSNYRFTIAEGDDAPKFYPFADNTTFSANRAYLQIPTAWLPATAQKSLNIRFDDGETTDIEELKGEPTVDASQSGEVKTVYDLQGRVVENPTNGIYIVNGKKVIIK